MQVGNCIMSMLVYVVPISDKPEFRGTCGSSSFPDHVNWWLIKHPLQSGKPCDPTEEHHVLLIETHNLTNEYQMEIQHHSKEIHAIKTHNSLLCLHFSEVLQADKSLMRATRGGCHFPGCVTLSLLPPNDWQ